MEAVKGEQTKLGCGFGVPAWLQKGRRQKNKVPSSIMGTLVCAGSSTPPWRRGKHPLSTQQEQPHLCMQAWLQGKNSSSIVTLLLLTPVTPIVFTNCPYYLSFHLVRREEDRVIFFLQSQDIRRPQMIRSYFIL
jgi:hypothetical protein